MRTPSDDRSAILRRRARFVGSALLALSGCTPSKTPEVGSSPPPVTVAEPAEGESAPGQPPPAAGGEERPDPMPSLEVPEDAIGVALDMYESLARHVPPIHRAIDELLANRPAGCDLSDSACEKRWRIVAARIEELAADIAALEPLCPGTSAEARRYGRRVKEHKDYALGRLRALDREIEQSLSGSGDRWRKLRQASPSNRPMACLDCADW